MTLELIAISGPAGSGKSEASAFFQRMGFQNIKFADTLKDMTRTFLEHIENVGGLSFDAGEEIEDCIEGSLKNQPVIFEKITPRRIMQTLGSEWGRDCIDKDIWVQIVKSKIESGSYGNKIVIDDLRFDNEYEMVKALGGTVINLTRPDISKVQAHMSEVGTKFDHQIVNDSTVEDLSTKLESFVQAANFFRIRDLAKEFHAKNKAAGWWDERVKMTYENIDYQIGNLIHSEISEALEGFRKGLVDDKLPEFENFWVELADVLIRSLDYVGWKISNGVTHYYDLSLDRQFSSMSIEATDKQKLIATAHRYVMDAFNPIYTKYNKTRQAEHLYLLIRLIEDFSEANGVNIWHIVDKKDQYNQVRADHKKENRAKAGGKAF